MYAAWPFHQLYTKNPYSLILKDTAAKIMHKIHVAGVSVLTFFWYCIVFLLLLVITLKLQANPCWKQTPKTKQKNGSGINNNFQIWIQQKQVSMFLLNKLKELSIITTERHNIYNMYQV